MGPIFAAILLGRLTGLAVVGTYRILFVEARMMRGDTARSRFDRGKFLVILFRLLIGALTTAEALGVAVALFHSRAARARSRIRLARLARAVHDPVRLVIVAFDLGDFYYWQAPQSSGYLTSLWQLKPLLLVLITLPAKFSR